MSGGVIAGGVTFSRQHLHSLNQPGVRPESEFERFDGLDVMAGLERGAVPGGAKRDRRRRSRRAEGRLESPVLGNRHDVSVFEIALHDRQQARDFVEAGGFGLQPPVFHPLLQAHGHLRSEISFPRAQPN